MGIIWFVVGFTIGGLAAFAYLYWTGKLKS